MNLRLLPGGQIRPTLTPLRPLGSIGTGGTFGQGGNVINGAAFVRSLDGGSTFSKAAIVVQYNPFISDVFSGNGTRQCGDAQYNCPTGFTFPRFDLAAPTLATRGGDVEMAVKPRV